MKLIIDIPEEEYKMRLLWAKSDSLCSPDTILIAKGVPYEETLKYFPPCEDCNRKMEEIRQAYDKMKAMERPQGEWELSSIQVVGENWYKCSICGRKIRTSTYHLKEYPFCHCGADMRGNTNASN